jgi:sRNA-binding protein
MASLTERQARALARQQAAEAAAKARFDALSPERKAAIKAREKAAADRAAAVAAARAARKKEPKPIVDPPRGKDTTYFPNLDMEIPNNELGRPIYAFTNRNSGGIAKAATVNPVYNTYGD